MKIVDSDAFLDMPLSTQCLYFHLNMRADDDGFIGNPKRIMKVIGASEDDLKILIAKRFLLLFEDGVIVIKHWRMHNTLSQNRYHETQYLDEKSMLRLKDNGSYSLDRGEVIDDAKLIGAKKEYDKKQRLNNGSTTADSDLGLDLDTVEDIDKDIVGQAPTPPPYKVIIDYLNQKTNSHYQSTTKSTQTKINARIKEGATVEDFMLVIDLKSSQWMGDKKMEAYLRPETLFAASHFESYLNEAKRNAAVKPKHSGISQRLAAEVSVDVDESSDFD